MILVLNDVDDSTSTKSKNTFTDVLGLGKATESLAKSFGKLLEKVPANKLNAGMSFVVIIFIIYAIFIVTVLKINPQK